jgi:hypothetical protein
VVKELLEDTNTLQKLTLFKQVQDSVITEIASDLDFNFDSESTPQQAEEKGVVEDNVKLSAYFSDIYKTLLDNMTSWHRFNETV